MAAVYGHFRICQSCPAILSNWKIQKWLNKAAIWNGVNMLLIYELKLPFFKNHFKIMNYNLHDLEVFTLGLAPLKWAKLNTLLCFLLVIYTIKWNQANLFFKKPKLIISLTQSDRYDNSVELYSIKQLNLQCKLVTDWNGTNPNLN